MNSGMPWEVSGVRPQARQTARDAARRAGMSIGEWLDSVISASAQADETAVGRTAERDVNPKGDERGEKRSQTGTDRNLAELHQRLDNLGRRLGHMTTLHAASRARSGAEPVAPARELSEIVATLERKLDQVIAEGRSGKDSVEQRGNAAGRAIGGLDVEPAHAVPGVSTPLDQALLEIADRQRALDGSPQPPAAAPAARASISSDALPRACTQELSALEQQLRQINENLRPCGVDKAIDVLRDDLAQIGVMLQEAMPGRSVQAIDDEIRNLAERIDSSRNAGADGTALESIERGLGEIRDALRDFALPDRAGLDRELQQLSQKIDELGQNSRDPAGLRQLESAIIGLRSIVSHTASNDALATLSGEVRTLAEKVDRAIAESGNDNVVNALEERIATLADALAARNGKSSSVPHELEAVLRALVDKIEQVQLAPGDQAVVGHLEDRIAKLVEKLDASGARLNHLEAIERGLAELLIHLEHHRVANPTGLASVPAGVDELSLNVIDLKQTGRKTHEAIELVRGTLGHVVDRLAMIETDMRSKGTRSPESSLSDAPLLSREGAATAKSSTSPVWDAVGVPRSAAQTVEKTGSAGGDYSHEKAITPETPPKPAGLRSSPEAAFTPSQFTEFNPTPASKRDQAASAERRAIDPTLPPDHPLEPGATASRRGPPGSPAERIAASESVLLSTKPAAAPERGNASDFIAAARRAAQAAGRSPPGPGAASGTREIASAAGKLAKRVGKLRALIVGTSAIVMVCGGLQIGRMALSSSDDSQTASQQPGKQTTLRDQATEALIAAQPPLGGAPSSSNEPGSAGLAPAGPSFAQQSWAFPPSAVPVLSDPQIETAEVRSATSQPGKKAAGPPQGEITGSISANSDAPRTVGVPPSPVSIPAFPAATPARPNPSSAALAPSPDRLPAAFGSRLRSAAAKGDAAAQYEIASRYAEGRGVTQNLTAAAEWYERAAKHGLVPAQFRLGGLYEKGLGVKKDLDAARGYYLAAGEAGNAKALHNLAVLYAEGIDGKPDYQTAAKWFRKAADYGTADSQYNLAILYTRGIGVEQNLAEAYKWFALAARGGDDDAARKQDDVASRIDSNSREMAAQAVQSWTPRKQPDAAVEVSIPSGGWDEAASQPATAARQKPLVIAPKLDLATPHSVQ